MRTKLARVIGVMLLAEDRPMTAELVARRLNCSEGVVDECLSMLVEKGVVLCARSIGLDVGEPWH